MGIGPIPWMAVARYAEVYGLDLDELEDLDHYVRAMEVALADHEAKKQKKGAS